MKTIQKVEGALQDLFEEYKLKNKLTISLVRNWVLNENGKSPIDASNRYQMKWLHYFEKVKDLDKLNKIFGVFTDAWNYFPHKSLDGKAPKDLYEQEILKGKTQEKHPNQKKPDFIVGNKKIPWDEYWFMIAEMERRQIPFKKWVETDLLPKYEKFLKENLSKRVVDKHMTVADLFFKRVLHVGFIKFEEIRADFIQDEFPGWWQTHVAGCSLTEAGVRSSLRKLFSQIEILYEKDISKFGFTK